MSIVHLRGTRYQSLQLQQSEVVPPGHATGQVQVSLRDLGPWWILHLPGYPVALLRAPWIHNFGSGMDLMDLMDVMDLVEDPKDLRIDRSRAAVLP